MSEGADVFDLLGLTEYEETALTELIRMGQTTAPNLAEATGIPKARIYGVLDALSDRLEVDIARAPARADERAYVHYPCQTMA